MSSEIRTIMDKFASRIDILLIGGDFANVDHSKDNEEDFSTSEKEESQTYEEKLLRRIV